MAHESICRKIKGLLGSAGDPPAEAGDGWSSGNEKFQGAYSDSVILNQAGRAAGCIEGAAAGSQPPQNTFSYYHVLIDR